MERVVVVEEGITVMKGYQRNFAGLHVLYQNMSGDLIVY